MLWTVVAGYCGRALMLWYPHEGALGLGVLGIAGWGAVVDRTRLWNASSVPQQCAPGAHLVSYVKVPVV